MAAEGCPGGIATAKPGREGWAYEELWDLAVEADGSGTVERTRYRGVYLLYASPVKLVSVARSDNLAFVRKLIISSKCYKIKQLNKSDIVNYFSNRMDEPGCVDLRLRGKSKDLIVEYNKRMGAEVRKARKPCNRMVVVEGVDDIIIVAVGKVASCGPYCTLVIDEDLERHYIR